jgi:hypothetical protein
MERNAQKRESINVLQEAIDLQIKKSNDYQNPNSTIRQADYYPNGIDDLITTVHAKTLRLRSVTGAMKHDPSYKQNFESIEDSCKDIINYASFIVAYCRGKIDGQDPNRDVFNRPKGKK